MDFFIPEWLQNRQIEEELCASLYENFSPKTRSYIKTAIAFHFQLWKEQDTSNTTILAKSKGFSYTQSIYPCPYVFFFIDEKNMSPAMLLGSVCAAILSGTKNCLFFFKDSTSTIAIPLLELAGMENIFILEEDFFSMPSILSSTISNTMPSAKFSASSDTEPAELGNINDLKSLCMHWHEESSQKGRYIFFSEKSSKNNPFLTMENLATELAIPSYTNHFTQKIIVSPNLDGELNEILLYAHPEATILESALFLEKSLELQSKNSLGKSEKKNVQNCPDISFDNKINSPIILEKALAFFYPTQSPCFFMEKSLIATLFRNEK